MCRATKSLTQIRWRSASRAESAQRPFLPCPATDGDEGPFEGELLHLRYMRLSSSGYALTGEAGSAVDARFLRGR